MTRARLTHAFTTGHTMHSVVSLETIQRQAQAAAHKYSDINDACPYPFGSDAAHAFKHAFKAAREAILSNPSPAHP